MKFKCALYLYTNNRSASNILRICSFSKQKWQQLASKLRNHDYSRKVNIYQLFFPNQLFYPSLFPIRLHLKLTKKNKHKFFFPSPLLPFLLPLSFSLFLWLFFHSFLQRETSVLIPLSRHLEPELIDPNISPSLPSHSVSHIQILWVCAHLSEGQDREDWKRENEQRRVEGRWAIEHSIKR